MRSLEDHLSPQELVSLPESSETFSAAESGQQDLLHHLQQCEACSSLAQAHWIFHGLRDSQMSGESCPQENDEIWLVLAAGLRQEQASSLLAHTASCSRCGAAWEEARELMRAEGFESEQAAPAVEGLESSTRAWQRRIGTQLAAQSSIHALDPIAAPTTSWPARQPAIVSSRRRLPVWMTLAAAVVILCAATVGAVAIWQAAHPSEARLLALAYNKQRRLVLRVPGGNPVAIASGTRGAADRLTDPSELLELRLRAQKNIDRNPGSAYWHQIMGEVNLLEGDGLAARGNLETAQTTDAALPRLESDLGAAWFEIGDKSGNAEAYAQAAELYSKEINRGPKDQALLYYNRAQCWQRQNLDENALDDLRNSLRLEQSASWRRQIEAEIEKLSTHTAIPRRTQGLELTSTLASDGYETALAEATQKWISQWSDSDEARSKILRVARLGVTHQDRWLQDWIVARHTPMSEEADRHLGAAVTAASAGESERSFAESHHAVELYRRAHQEPGLVRAQLAESYALQRLGRTDECLGETTKLMTMPLLVNYSWLLARALNVQADCFEMSGNFQAEEARLDHALDLSREAELPLLHIYTLGGQAELAQTKGLQAATWQMGSDDLLQCHLMLCPGLSEYTFLYLLVQSAQELQMPHVTAEVMRIAVRLAGQTGNAVTHAYALETLGTLLGRIGDYEGSTKTFQSALDIAYAGNRGPAAAIYQADWQTDRAEILSRRGMHRAALTLLEQNGSVILASGYLPGRLHYLSQLAKTQRLFGDAQAAKASAWRAVHEAERSLASLRSSLEKEHWQRANESEYTELVKDYLQLDDDTNALMTWERFRAAPYRASSNSGTEPDVGVPSPGLAKERVLVLARIDDRYVGWLVGVVPLRVLKRADLGDATNIQQTASTFYHLCTDPGSRLSDIRVVGSHLYAQLIQPFREQLGAPDRLWVEADASLAMIPFSALTLPEGNWLNTSMEVALVPAWWMIHPAQSLTETTISPAMSLLAVSGFNQRETTDSELPSIAQMFKKAKVLQGSGTTSQAVLQEIQMADVFHFSGHALSSVEPAAVLTQVDSLTPNSIGSVRMRHCSLGVLAACNTTATDPDQIDKLPDLRNAFLLAGMRSVVASNWDVDDASTHALMSTFYRRVTNGLVPTQSLKAAQESVRSSNGWQHPYYWAAFELFRG